MEDDIFLSVAIDLYKNGTWNRETLEKQIWIHAKENGLDEKAIKELLSRVVPKKEISIEEKREFIKNVKFKNGDFKYPNAVDEMPDELVERIYDSETKRKEVNEPEIETVNEEKVETPNFIPKVNVPKIEIPNMIVPINNNEEGTKKETEEQTKEGKIEETKKEIEEQNKESNPILDRIMPETEEDYEEVHKNITNPEIDSNVTKVDASPERIDKLKKRKNKVINFFIKSAIIVTTLLLLHPIESLPLIGGYLYLASKIKDGTFNPKTKVGQSAKNVIEAIMNVGMNEKVEEERGKTK